MKPTANLRFVERWETSLDTHETRKIRILQQLWMPTNEPYEEWLEIKDGKWFDIPLEEEK